MKIKKYLFLCIFISCFQASVTSAKITTVTLESGSKALQYLPQNFNPLKSYPFIMALHGMGEYTRPTLDKWIDIADHYGYILICPVGSNFKRGFTKKPVDDRAQFLAFKKHLESQYKIRTKESILAGFSRGGSYAIETGILYPEDFPNVLSMFGYFNKINYEHLISMNRDYRQSQFYILTGLGDYSELSSSKGYMALQERGIAIQLEIIYQLFHRYPRDFLNHFGEIRSWIKSQKEESNYAIY